MAQVNFRIDDDVKQDADALFDRLGMTLSTAITVFLRQSIARRGLPFEVTEDPFYSPSNQAYLARAIDDVEHGRNCHFHELVALDDESSHPVAKHRRTLRRTPRAKALA